MTLHLWNCALLPPKKRDFSEITGWSGKTWEFLGVKVLLLRYLSFFEQIAPKGLGSRVPTYKGVKPVAGGLRHNR